jgi:uncharacterized protein YycO
MSDKPGKLIYMVTIQLITEADFASWFIRYATWSDYSHVDFVLHNYLSKNGKVYDGLLGSRMDGGVQLRPWNYGKFTKVAQYQADVDESHSVEIIEYAISQIGKPYDKSGILNFGLHRNWQSDDSWFCSELVEASFEHGDWPLLDVDLASRVTPGDLTLSERLTYIEPPYGN